jgi:arginine decarboxylase
VKCIKVYIALKKESPTLDSAKYWWRISNQNSLAFEYDYQYMIDEIINQIKIACDEAEAKFHHTEFGSFYVGESGGAIYQICIKNNKMIGRNGI